QSTGTTRERRRALPAIAFALCTQIHCAPRFTVHPDSLCTQIHRLRFSGVPTEMAARIFRGYSLNWQCFAGGNKLWAAWL
ncbi:MAG TPA: hypothetical protein VJ283_09715, partial [Trebonia sp.]|nr:hypothetical protein [Trebonia sp.]